MNLPVKIIIGVICMVTIAIGAALLFQPPLDKIQRSIESELVTVKHIQASEFERLAPADRVIFDVREKDEFNVSHIQGAINISPDIDAQEFAEDYAYLLNGKQAVFYCSVGRRSSDLIARLDALPQSDIAQRSVNLVGGVFNWINQGRALNGDKVHPYNDYWGRLIDDPENISYKPYRN